MTAPRRAFHVNIIAGADTLSDLFMLLEHFQNEMELGSKSCVNGGSSSGGTFDLTVNPAMTHDRYHEELKAYLKENKTNHLEDPSAKTDLNERLK